LLQCGAAASRGNGAPVRAPPRRIYDLKGSERSRFNADAAANPHDSGEVHLDDNLRRANLQVRLRCPGLRWFAATLGRLPAPWSVSCPLFGARDAAHPGTACRRYAQCAPAGDLCATCATRRKHHASRSLGPTRPRQAPILVEQPLLRPMEDALWRDTAFLSALGVMDYSLLVGVDRTTNTLVVAIIDFIR
jgi:hypothetical protein